MLSAVGWSSSGQRLKGDQSAPPTAHPETPPVVSVERRRLQQQWTARGQEAGEGQTVVLHVHHVDDVIDLVSNQQHLQQLRFVVKQQLKDEFCFFVFNLKKAGRSCTGRLSDSSRCMGVLSLENYHTRKCYFVL